MFSINAVSLIALLLQQPSPTPVVHAQAEQSQTGKQKQVVADQKSPADPATARIDQLEAEVSRWKQTQQQNQGNGSAAPGWIAAFFTGGIAIVSALQYLAIHKQAGYMREALGETREATQAAIRSAELGEKNLALAQQAAASATALNQASITALGKIADAAEYLQAHYEEGNR